MKKKFLYLLIFFVFGFFSQVLLSQTIYNPDQSVARNWNEALLEAIRNDFARPTVHARNLFHSSAMMYDLWAVYDNTSDMFFLGNTVGGYTCAFTAEQRTQVRNATNDIEQARELAIAYAMNRLLRHRFQFSPRPGATFLAFNELVDAYAVDESFTSTDFNGGSAAALGNYLAGCIIAFGLQDGSNEQNFYANTYYEPVNGPLDPLSAGSQGLIDSDHWQPLELDIFIDQAGNETSIPPFLGAEWGEVTPFSLSSEDLNIYTRDGRSYWVYYDPGVPALSQGANARLAEYQWGHTLIALWSAHLDPADGVMWDISPASIGRTMTLPTTIEGLRAFYNDLQGGSTDRGHELNPASGEPYEPQLVPRGDYVRVLAEFWADGPDSETPPGHWFTILNSAVSDHSSFEKRFEGVGPVLSDLEWDVKAYFALGGAVHDAAITAWGIKGWYDYIRPISAIRHMASLGQSTEASLSSYDPHGIPLTEGLIEIVEAGDALAGDNNEHVGKIKLYAWRGPAYIEDPNINTAGVGWILAENWWPYQRPSFVTPPFAGYISGHSTFSRAAAEVLTRLTGDEYFPGGMGEFLAPRNEFLVFEEGPSVDITLQWATYRDASDQTSLSRIWGGIHPPVDDVPGRIIGEQVGLDAYEFAKRYFEGTATEEPPSTVSTPEPRTSGSGALSILLVMGMILLACGKAITRRLG